jgi:hypothetical protein
MEHSGIKIKLLEFPRLKLSHEKNIHNKVYNSDINLAIPKGKKFVAWFTIYNNKNICLLLDLNDNKEIKNFHICYLSFSDYLCIEDGTVLYGTLFKLTNNSSKINNTKCFCIEDIYYYKGEKITNTYYNKLQILYKFLNNDILQNVLTNDTILFGLPLINNNFTDLLKDITTLPYTIDYIQFRSIKNDTILNMKYIKSNKYNNNNNKLHLEQAIFKVIPDIQNDIYNLYIYNIITNKEEFYDIAFIPDYKTSVMMNNLFRNIKENNNLDLLEESDNEEEFEDNRIDKYVNLTKTYKMVCLFNNKFKKWYPVSIARKNDKIITSKLLN